VGHITASLDDEQLQAIELLDSLDRGSNTNVGSRATRTQVASKSQSQSTLLDELLAVLCILLALFMGWIIRGSTAY